MKVIYVHHGQRLKGNPPSQEDNLTELGVKDCELVSKLLEERKKNIKAVYSSNFLRCRRTAEIVNANLNVPLIFDDRLNEFRSFKNETWVDAQTRILNFLDEIEQKYDRDDFVICVTSGVNVGAFICKAYHLPPSENTPFLGIPSCSPIMFDYNE